MPGEVEGKSAADGCARSLGGIEAPGALVVARIPSVSVVPASVVPVCVVSRCVFTSVFKCVLRRTHSVGTRAGMKETPCVEATPCVSEAPCVSEPPGMSEPPCVSGVFVSVPECVLPGTPCVKGAPQG